MTATADIQLNHKRDPAAYVQCYSQLAEQHGDYESYRLLGAALMRIQEPEKAIKAGCCEPVLVTLLLLVPLLLLLLLLMLLLLLLLLLMLLLLLLLLLLLMLSSHLVPSRIVS